MMGMPRGRSRGASAGGVLTTESTSIMDTAAAGSGTGVTVLESEHEDVMDEIDRIEEDHVREMQRIEAANRGSDYVSPFDNQAMKQPRRPSAAEMKAQDDEELQHKMGMDMIADRNKLNRAFDVAAEKAKIQIGDAFDGNPAAGAAGGGSDSPMASTGRYTKDSTPEEVRNAALADVQQAEDSVKRSFRHNFNVDNLDIPSIREKRRMEIEAAVRKEREENM